MAVVAHQHHGFKPPIKSPRCRLPSFTHFDFFMCEPNQLDATHTSGPIILVGATFPRSVSTPCLTLTSKVEEEVNINPRVQLIGGQTAPQVRALVVEVAIAIASGADSIPIPDGLGGAYILRNRNGDTIAVAKPIDEEPLALNNPKGFAGRMLGQPGLKRSICVGETGIRELAAYLLDRGGFAGVPPTGLVKFSNFSFHVNKLAPIATPVYKIASLQLYVDHESDAGDLSPSGFSVSSVHRIGILDIRLLNIDRHSGNILVKKHEHGKKYALGVMELIPIDHGLCLPEWLDDPYFEWLHWPQASVPFSEAEMEYISKLDPLEDAKLLRTQIPCLKESSIRVLIVCTVFLKLAVFAGLCLGDIGEMLTRDHHGGVVTPSVLESVCTRAKDTTFMAHDDIGCGEEVELSNKQGNDDNDQMFYFDEEFENENTINDQSKASMGNPPLPPSSNMIPERPVKGLVTTTNKFDPMMVEAKECADCDARMINKRTEGVDIKGKDRGKMGNLFKSISFAAPCPKEHEEKGVSLGDMNEQEWDFFLEMFQRLLPEVFEERKSNGLTQRVGTA